MYTDRSPKRSAKAPAPSASPARVAINTTMTHWTAARSASKASRIAGRATFTEKSREASIIPSPAATAISTARQRGRRRAPPADEDGTDAAGDGTAGQLNPAKSGAPE